MKLDLPARLAILVATTLALGCAHAPRDEGALAWHYEVTPAAALDRLDVKLCFRDRVPTRLVADDEAAAAYVLDPRELAGGRALKAAAHADKL